LNTRILNGLDLDKCTTAAWNTVWSVDSCGSLLDFRPCLKVNKVPVVQAMIIFSATGDHNIVETSRNEIVYTIVLLIFVLFIVIILGR